MPSDRIRQEEMTGDLGPDYLRGRRGAAGSDMGGQTFGQPGFGQPGFGGGEEPPRRSRLLPLVIAFFALAAFAGIVWYAYEWGVGDVEPEHLPVVQAKTGPIKEKPAEPGGLEVPYTDSAVLNRDGSQAPSKVESLLPPPEEPVAVPKAPEPKPVPKPAPAAEPKPAETSAHAAATAETAPASQPAPAVEAAKPSDLPELPKPAAPAGQGAQPAPAESKTAETQAPQAAASVAPATEAPASASPASEPAAEKPVEAPKPVAEAPAAPPVAAKEVAPSPVEMPKSVAPATAASPAEVKPGSWVAQLAALRKESEAQEAWSRMQARHKDLLGSLPLLLERIDLGDRGVFYRVQTGPLPNRATALDLCAQLKAAGQDCIAKTR